MEEKYKLMLGDCLDKLNLVEDNSIDLCLTDLPYQITGSHWDKLIPFEPMWEHLNRVMKEKSVICLFAGQPFTSKLIVSNLEMFRYEWIWEKEQGVNFQNAKKQPLKIHESIIIFSKSPVYYPQGLVACEITKTNKGKTGRINHISNIKESGYTQTHKSYPKSVLRFNTERWCHPNQKPVTLLKYLIKTYSKKGDTILDFTMGSGSTGVASLTEDRKFIGIEKDIRIFDTARQRIECLNI